MAETTVTVSLESPVEPFHLQQAINRAVHELLNTQDRDKGGRDTEVMLQGVPTWVTVWDNIQFDLTTVRVDTYWQPDGSCQVTATGTKAH